MRKPDFELRITDDGSPTIYANRFKSSYHSTHGAITESKHIFIDAGLNDLIQREGLKELSILEIGFGTGLNAFLSLLEAKSQSISINYTTLELYPLGYDIVNRLNYAELLKVPAYNKYFLAMHQVDTEIWNDLTPLFRFRCLQQNFEEYNYPKNSFDLIFFDPFDPEVHRAMWEKAFLKKMVASLKEGGVLITYGAKGSFKRALKSLNLKVEPIPGPPGKREITRAVK